MDEAWVEPRPPSARDDRTFREDVEEETVRVGPLIGYSFGSRAGAHERQQIRSRRGARTARRSIVLGAVFGG